MRSVIYEFENIYPYSILISKKFDSKDLSERFYVVDTNNDLQESDFEINPRTIARTIEVVGKQDLFRHVLILLVRQKEIKEGVIAHEAYHAANMIAYSCDFLPADIAYDEPVAYLVQWIAECEKSVLMGKAEKEYGY